MKLKAKNKERRFLNKSAGERKNAVRRASAGRKTPTKAIRCATVEKTAQTPAKAVKGVTVEKKTVQTTEKAVKGATVEKKTAQTPEKAVKGATVEKKTAQTPENVSVNATETQETKSATTETKTTEEASVNPTETKTAQTPENTSAKATETQTDESVSKKKKKEKKTKEKKEKKRKEKYTEEKEKKIPEKTGKLILYAGGTLMVLFFFMVVFQRLNTQCMDAQAHISKLTLEEEQCRQMKENQRENEAEERRLQSEIEKILNEFPADIKEEDSILHANALEESINIKFDDIVFQQKNLVQVGQESGYTLFEKPVQYVFEAGYEPTKQLLAVMSQAQEHTNVFGITLSYDNETGGLYGTLYANYFSIEGGEREYLAPTNPDVSIGNINMFGTAE